MSDSSTTARPEPGERPKAEPPSTTAPATPRGPSLLARLISMFVRAPSLRDDLEVALEHEASGETQDFSIPERTILQNVLQLGDKHVEDVMVPRADIEAIDIECTLGDMIARFRKVGHSRIPVYAETIDNISGFIHVKDALRRITAEVNDPDKKDIPIRLVTPTLKSKLGKLDIMRQVLFVPPLMPVGDLLQQMQLKRVHMAIVIDEYGGTDGVVTIEDLLEAVVGEIEDEHDEEDRPLIRKLNANNFIASARAELGEVREAVGAPFDPGELADEVDTIGGLVFDLAGHVPPPGEVVAGVNGVSGFEFEVLQSDGRQIQKLKIRRLKPAARPRPKAKPAAAAVDGEAPPADAAKAAE